MTGHFTTLDGCERWAHIFETEKFLKVPYSVQTPMSMKEPYRPRSTSYDFRVYKLESIEVKRGLAHYVEVYSG